MLTKIENLISKYDRKSLALPSKLIAEEILALLKQEGYTPPHGYDTSSGVCEVCDQLNSDKMRAHGWLHKDDPIEGLEVERECACKYHKDKLDKEGTPELKKYIDCPLPPFGCGNTGKITSPFTISDALTMIKGMVEELTVYTKDVLEVHCYSLTTPSGGKVVGKDCGNIFSSVVVHDEVLCPKCNLSHKDKTLNEQTNSLLTLFIGEPCVHLYDLCRYIYRFFDSIKEEQMQRYDLDESKGYPIAQIVQIDDGEYILHDDHMAEIDELGNYINALTSAKIEAETKWSELEQKNKVLQSELKDYEKSMERANGEIKKYKSLYEMWKGAKGNKEAK